MLAAAQNEFHLRISRLLYNIAPKPYSVHIYLTKTYANNSLTVSTQFQVLASVYRGLLNILGESGHSPDQVAAAVGVKLDALRTPQAMLSIEQITKLWELGYECRGETIGLEVAQRVRLIDFQDIGVFLTSTENIEDWLHQIENYSSLFSNIAELVSQRTALGLEAQINYYAAVPLKYERLDFLALFAPVLASQYLESPLKLKKVELTRPCPEDPAPWEDAFGTTIKWGSKATKYTIDYEEANRLILTRNNNTKKGFQTILNSRLLSRRTLQPIDEVRAAIVNHLPNGAPSITSVASALNLSARSLQRRLNNAHTSFSTLLSSIREEMAKEYLEQGIPHSKISQLLGYSDPAVFKRAFKRWTGKPASTARRQGNKD